MSCEGAVLHGIVSMMMHVLCACLIHLIMHNAERMYICLYSPLRKSTECSTAIPWSESNVSDQFTSLSCVLCNIVCLVVYVVPWMHGR